MDLEPESPFVDVHSRCAPHRTSIGSRAIASMIDDNVTSRGGSFSLLVLQQLIR